MIIGNRITLRPVLPKDVEVIYLWENNPENWEVSGTIVPFSKQEIEAFVYENHTLKEHQQKRFIIELKESELVIGTIDLFEYNELKKNVGIGILIAEKEQRNKGFGLEAIKLIADFCRNELKLVNLFCNISTNNTSSICLFEKCGFQYINQRELFGKQVNYYELTL